MIRLPEIILQEIIRKLKTSGSVYIEGIGEFYLTVFSKKRPFITSGKGNMVEVKKKSFTRLSFRPSPRLKIEVQ